MDSEGLTLSRVIGIVGWKNSGKTTLVEALLRELTDRGLRVSTIKHAHHHFDVDIPGKDSWRHREAGAQEVLVASSQRWALMHETGGAHDPNLLDMLPRLSPCDLVLVEGFKHGPHRKIEVRRAASGGTLLADQDETILAVATDDPVLAGRHRCLSLANIAAIADFIWNEMKPCAS
ncbi:MAG: molybdopterin-guanine dinucleotide biosynthesis protein B [Alphaproteobacteria bacterium]|nr:molybdopterin-guanine dinucleotide biosynthesis protein B [Alphaproteobacteria bacterium]MDE2111966.1 molybdopterin-guanine dinucleotide biosynthesis protein B [Alphaproteobacteria bacterium]MDE2492530.1 molybdopterin-guanine dinucleotide biosynthesis protein B [Alphaproteobacteria bacterium]